MFLPFADGDRTPKGELPLWKSMQNSFLLQQGPAATPPACSDAARRSPPIPASAGFAHLRRCCASPAGWHCHPGIAMIYLPSLLVFIILDVSWIAL